MVAKIKTPEVERMKNAVVKIQFFSLSYGLGLLACSNSELLLKL
jgi:hypothetical protein